MVLKTTCANCGNNNLDEDDVRGLKSNCRKCGREYKVGEEHRFSKWCDHILGIAIRLTYRLLAVVLVLGWLAIAAISAFGVLMVVIFSASTPELDSGLSTMAAAIIQAVVSWLGVSVMISFFAVLFRIERNQRMNLTQ